MAVNISSGDILTSEQLTKHMIIYAGPGAGKTHFLVENIKNIIKSNPVISQSKARKILCITYTNAAVDEIKRRLDKYADAVEIYTIHGFIIEYIIAPFQLDLKRIMSETFGITVSPKSKITSQIEGIGILHGYDKEKIYEYINNETAGSEELTYSKKVMGDVQVDNERYLLDGTSKLKSPTKKIKGQTKSIVDDRHISPIKKFTWTVANKLTHDEILYFGYRILKDNSMATYALRVKFPFIFVDEFQDTNPVQTLLIKHLGKKSTILGIIGDIAQSIYSFQGARPSQFSNFRPSGEREFVKYNIIGNRRSTANIVSLCNYFRQSDGLAQESIKTYKDNEEKRQIEAHKIHIVVGETLTAIEIIKNVLEDGGVVLTRSWAAAFAYIKDVSEEQIKILKAIYNSYYNSPIDIRAEIAEHNNVSWVRSFKFIFMLWEAYTSGSFIDVVNAISLYKKIERKKILPANIIKIKKMLNSLFSNIKSVSTPVALIDKFNSLLSEENYRSVAQLFSDDETFALRCFSEFDQDSLVENVSKLCWGTAYKLFTEVFSSNSKYMTVHQAKGLEWDKVIISLIPSKRYDGTDLEKMYSLPQILKEEPADEFTRMYYVACSRAKEELYIHLPDDSKLKEIIQTKFDNYNNKALHKFEYEFIL